MFPLWHWQVAGSTFPVTEHAHPVAGFPVACPMHMHWACWALNSARVPQLVGVASLVFPLTRMWSV